MVSLMDLWLPIVLSAIAVFIAGAIAWMALPHHKDDYRKLSTEDAVLVSIRANAVPPGQYMFPYCGSPADLKDPEATRRHEAGQLPLHVLRRIAGAVHPAARRLDVDARGRALACRRRSG